MSDNTESENEEITDEEIQFFKDTVQQFLKLQDEITTLEKALKDRKSTKKKLSDTISLFLNEKDISHINLQGNYKGKEIRYDTITKKETYNEKGMMNILMGCISNQDDIEKIYTKMEENRKTKTVSKLKLKKISKESRTSSILNAIKDDDTEENTENLPENLNYLNNS
mgnify:CR=1 FL=1|tara:strand:+ start:4116 stop:4619 length:504 start_codon:yes stop_codon:yes gene_type:complete